MFKKFENSVRKRIREVENIGKKFPNLPKRENAPQSWNDNAKHLADYYCGKYGIIPFNDNKIIARCLTDGQTINDLPLFYKEEVIVKRGLENRKAILQEIMQISDGFSDSYAKKVLNCENLVLQSDGNFVIPESDFKELYASEQKTCETIKVNENVKKATMFENSFIELSLISSGGFSSVFKCEHRLTHKLYAIKKISFEQESEQKVLNELKILSELESSFVVKYINSWIEENYYLESHSSDSNEKNKDLNQLFYSPLRTQLLHIQMELCSLTLRDVINKITAECVITPNNTLSLIGYYISSELLYEILECVQYLHQLNPIIIHRDLKPENILINFINNRFVKLGDFGLSTLHEYTDQSHTKYIGTKNYRSFEVNSTNKYSTKSDIYSLGIILQELFQIESSCKTNYLPEITLKIKYISDLITKLVSYDPDDRPKCDHVLNEKHLWLLSDSQLQCDHLFKYILHKKEKIESIETSFIEYFIQNKYKKFSAQIPTQSLLESHPQLSTTKNTGSLPSLMANLDINVTQDFDEFEYFTDSLMRSESGFGLRLVSGSVEGSGVVIGSILLGGVAHHNGVLKVGDQIIAINDENVIGLTHPDVVLRLTQTDTSVVNIRVKRKTYSSFV